VLERDGLFLRTTVVRSAPALQRERPGARRGLANDRLDRAVERIGIGPYM
jgi:hypothetical protein